MKTKRKLIQILSILFAILIIPFLFTSMLYANAESSINTRAVPSYVSYSDPVNISDNCKRMVVITTYLNEYDAEYDVPLKALNKGLDIRSKGEYTLSKQVEYSTVYTTEQVITEKYSSEIGTGAEFGIDIDIAELAIKATSKFTEEYSRQYTTSTTSTTSEIYVQSRTYNITEPADFGFYTITLKAYKAIKYMFRSYISIYESQYRDKEWKNWELIDDSQEYHYVYYYVPIDDATYAAFEKFDSAKAYYEYMNSYHAQF